MNELISEMAQIKLTAIETRLKEIEDTIIPLVEAGIELKAVIDQTSPEMEGSFLHAMLNQRYNRIREEVEALKEETTNLAAEVLKILTDLL